jgi:Exostosin family
MTSTDTLAAPVLKRPSLKQCSHFTVALCIGVCIGALLQAQSMGTSSPHVIPPNTNALPLRHWNQTTSSTIVKPEVPPMAVNNSNSSRHHFGEGPTRQVQMDDEHLRDEMPTAEEKVDDDFLTYRAQNYVPMQQHADSSSMISSGVAPDNLLEGKSCLRVAYSWDCRDCGPADNIHNNSNNITNRTSRQDCPMLPPNGICNPIPMSHWDEPHARQSTTHAATDTTTSHRHVLTHYGMRQTYEQLQCDSLDDCFDMSKCNYSPPASRMKLYAYGGVDGLAHHYVAQAVQRYPTLMEATLDPMDACLLIVTCDSHPAATITTATAPTLYHQGRNHLVWESSRCLGAHPDRPFDTTVHYQYAALASSSLMDTHVRRGYDVPLTRVRATMKEFGTHILPVDNEAPRKYLLSFKGNVFPWSQVWWQHRWLAAEYWNDGAADVVVDVTCPGKDNYTYPSNTYGELLLSSTFAFAPGGGSTGSYRFGEVLGLGGIPVVLPDFLPPMWPDLDWSGCLVRVSEARIVDLPRILRNISKDEIRSRQRRCKFLFRQTIGWKQVSRTWWEIDSGERAFLTSMKVWQKRIQEYHSTKMWQTAIESMGRVR